MRIHIGKFTLRIMDTMNWDSSTKGKWHTYTGVTTVLQITYSKPLSMREYQRRELSDRKQN